MESSWNLLIPVSSVASAPFAGQASDMLHLMFEVLAPHRSESGQSLLLVLAIFVFRWCEWLVTQQRQFKGSKR
jgi:hypothetical protein